MTNDSTTPPPADEPLSFSELDTAHIAARQAPDALLQELIELADARAGFGVGLLLNGMIVLGQLGTPEDLAKAVDAERARLVQRLEPPEDQAEEEWAQTREQFGQLSTSRLKKYRDQVAEIEAELDDAVGDREWAIDDLPGKLARQVIQVGSRAHLTLLRARIVAPGASGVTDIPVLRVQISQVAGWWVLETDEEGNTRTVLWDSDVPGLSRG